MAVGQSDDVDPAAAIAEAVEQCRAQLDGREPVAGILFAAPDNSTNRSGALSGRRSRA